jgi:hypothetical protein
MAEESFKGVWHDQLLPFFPEPSELALALDVTSAGLGVMDRYSSLLVANAGVRASGAAVWHLFLTRPLRARPRPACPWAPARKTPWRCVAGGQKRARGASGGDQARRAPLPFLFFPALTLPPHRCLCLTWIRSSAGAVPRGCVRGRRSGGGCGGCGGGGRAGTRFTRGGCAGSPPRLSSRPCAWPLSASCPCRTFRRRRRQGPARVRREGASCVVPAVPPRNLSPPFAVAGPIALSGAADAV